MRGLVLAAALAFITRAATLKQELKQLHDKETVELAQAKTKDEKRAIRMRYKDERKRIRERHRKMPR